MPLYPTSSVGKKLGMALTGLLLYGFLVGHLAGNLLLLRDDGGRAFSDYAGYLESHPQLVLPAEFGLLATFLLHVAFGISVALDSRRARPVGYARLRAVGGRCLSSRTMVWSGLAVFVFLGVHVSTFKFGDRLGGTLYDLVVGKFSQAAWAGGYAVAMAVLGFHLWHALGSAFQTLGLSAQAKLRGLSIALCLLIAGGFAAIPAALFLGR